MEKKKFRTALSDDDKNLLRMLLWGECPTREIYVGVGKHLKAICTGCGITGSQIMLERHRKDCEYKKFYKALARLQELIKG